MTAALLSVEEAQQRMLAPLEPLTREKLGIEEAVGRHLAADIEARRTQPPADLSAMDGYALAGNGPWRRVGESRCGAPYAGSLAPGECVRISTGAILPGGAETILIQENARLDGAMVIADEAPAPGRHIRRRGFEFARGNRLLAAGTRIDPAALALLRAGGHGEVTVRTLPRIAILDSGDELRDDPTACAEHEVPASNAAMVAALVQASLPCSVTRLPVLPDRLEAIAAALEQLREHDMVVLTGGASVGDHDFARPALEAVGAEIDFWKVAMKPGKPIMVARRARQLVLGLPGNPVSAFVTAFLFALPALRRLSGATDCIARSLPLPLGPAGCPPGGRRREFLRARWTADGLVPVSQQDSSALSGLVAADVLIDRPAGAAAGNPGEPVPAYLFKNGAIA